MAYRQSIPSGVPGVPDFFARSYQVEMFEASLKENIIVAMGTGSGKTHIALLRIMRELENSDGKKLIWFMAPTVALCLQQQKVIAQNIPAANSRTLTGLDKVELWTEQAVWDGVLNDVQVVVSTPAVLLDAMTHGFVRISRLGLLVFDEAHHAVRNDPANKIMQLFYHPTFKNLGPEAVPRILGLTASAASNSQDLLTIESNLNSVCTTPQAHRYELLEHTHKPELERVLFTPQVIDGAPRWGGTQKALLEAWEMLDLEDDPYVKKLKSKSPNGEALQTVLATGKTYCSTQLKNFVSRVVHISEELGIWAADYFIWASVEQLRARVHDHSLMLDLDNQEKKYLVGLLSKLPAPNIDVNSTDPADFPVSPKFQTLIDYLCKSDEQDFSGLIFVQQRTTVAVMAYLLSVHPLTRDRFRTGSFVGMSNSKKRGETLGDLLTTKIQRNTLDEFRDGRKNLIIATNVLEEGIDVSACSLVVSYNKPQNLKSFVQRRGRARHRHSKYAMVLSTEDDITQLDKWRALEQIMEKAYQEEQRHLEALRELETMTEDVNARFCVESTGALLTADNAMQHLFHFCSTLPREPHADPKPEFSFEAHDGGLLRGKVTLPSSVVPTARRAEGTSWWKTERAARKDAAFQAYKALHEHGLVNDNLLPLTKGKEFTLQDLGIAAIQDVSDQYDPWVDWAYLWPSPVVHESQIIMVTPAAVPPVEPMTLFWDGGITFTVEFEASKPVPLTEGNVQSMRIVTALYLQATTTRQLDNALDYITLFGPDVPHDQLPTWLDRYQGHEPASKVYSSKRDLALIGIVRDRERYGELLLFNKWINSDNGLELECDSYPKRRNLLHPQTTPTKRPADNEPPNPLAKKRIIPAPQCTIDRLPAAETVFGRFIAPILNSLETTLIVTALRNTILKNIPFTDPRHVLTAITTPSVQAGTDYQRYEFFGDTVLKFTVAFSLFYKHPSWHEGYLSKARDALVQNSTLARAALNAGLDKFILTKPFKARKWSAPLISYKLTTTPGKRALSSKILADIIESLIGAAYLDGGHAKAQAVICRFLPSFTLITPTPSQHSQTPHLINHESLEDQIGYIFRDKSLLLEALTHASHHDTATQSYQRLEFLGDAVLDMLVVDTILAHPNSGHLQQGEMTTIKHAVVNANLLGFLCLEVEWSNPSPNPSTNSPGELDDDIDDEKHHLHLYTHLRHNPLTPLLHTLSTSTLPRHKSLRKNILFALREGNTYPWPLLSRLAPDKFLSDIIESIIGAIFVDSGGDLGSCRGFVDRLGLLNYLGRILDGGVDVCHPIQRVQGRLQRLGSRIAGENGDGDEGEMWKFRFWTVRVQNASLGEGEGEDVETEIIADETGVRDTDIDTSTYPEINPSAPAKASASASVTKTASATYTCTISLSDLNLGVEQVVVSGAMSKEEAEVRAACRVLWILENRGVFLAISDRTTTTKRSKNWKARYKQRQRGAKTETTPPDQGPTLSTPSVQSAASRVETSSLDPAAAHPHLLLHPASPQQRNSATQPPPAPPLLQQ
ncbi:hypothetical protein BDV12DRAFT_187821 [Aspergillus spectabilis]